MGAAEPDRAGLCDHDGKVGRAMIKVARKGYKTPVLESEDINAV
jgi:hypothetical protein